MITFEELGIHPVHVDALKELGFEYPMPVQEKVIPLLLSGPVDIVALAQTGTGKTAAFGLPLIQMANPHSKFPEALILAPTRELCVQIAGDLNDFAKNTDDLKILPVYGGSSMEVQIKALKKGVQIVVATPGRLCDLIRRKAIKLNEVKTVVLDEADEMLNMGFIDSINDILSEVPKERATLLFSATMPNEVAMIARKYMHDPVEVTIGDKNSGALNIKHIYYTVHAKDKYTALKRIVDYYPNIYGIVFCRTRKDTQEVADKLMHDGYNAESLHGDLSQAQRDMVMQKFRIRHVKLLVATDVAARGLDVDDLTHIINYSIPEDLSVYTHRSGRTGRAGKAGISIMIINLKEKHYIKQIEKKINKSFVAAKVPGGREICEKQLFNMIAKMEEVDIEHTEIDSYLPAIYRKLEWLDKEEIIKRFVALEFVRFLDYYKNARDINVLDDRSQGSFRERDGGSFKERDRGSYKERDGGSYKERDRGSYKEREKGSYQKRERDTEGSERFRKNDSGFTRLFINQGKADGLFPLNLIELVNEHTPGKKVPLGRIDLFDRSASFEVGSDFADFLVNALQDQDFRGSEITVGLDTEKDGRKKDESDFRKRKKNTKDSGKSSKRKRISRD
ncbi:MAG: DEAD/DEAH box helicase [Bacteroidetes bacterium]|nr:DEAD/DEAH box helicase [Bacteroidota bacterium]